MEERLEHALEIYMTTRATMDEAALRAGVPYLKAREYISQKLLQQALKQRQHKYPKEVMERFYRELAACGNVTAAANAVGIPLKTARAWAKPRPSVRDLMLGSPQVADALIETAIKALARDDQRDAELSEIRTTLARELYHKAGRFWDRAKEKAAKDPVPHNELKALVIAGHYAVKDAQLLGGAPTERVENFLKGLEKMSDEELRRFVYEDFQLPNREDVRRLLEEDGE